MTTTSVVDASPPFFAPKLEVARVVLFDFDGVLIHGDAFYLFMRARYAGWPWRKLAALLCMPWLLLQAPFPGSRGMRLLIRIGLLGLGQRRYEALANNFAAELVRRRGQFCRDGLRVLRQHQAQGDRVIVVTGCEHTLVTGILRELGLRDLEVLASSVRLGWIGMCMHRHNVGLRKVKLLSQHGITAWQQAYSDSIQDAAMLKGADNAVLVNGTPSLCKKMERALGRSITRVEWF